MAVGLTGVTPMSVISGTVLATSFGTAFNHQSLGISTVDIAGDDVPLNHVSGDCQFGLS